jgi:spore germination protein GerM
MIPKRAATSGRWTLLALSGIVLLVLVIIFFRGGSRELIRPAGDIRPDETSESAEPAREAKEVVLFFPSDGDSLLHPERRRIPGGSSVAEEARQVVEELIKGSAQGYLSPLPPETRLRQLFVTKDGIAYVDFSKDIVEKHPSGSSAELTTVYSVVNTLTHNFRPIRKVFILVEGGERETLGGHINLSQAFVSLDSLIAQ